MTHDFDISRLQGQWQVAATSSRGQAFAAADPRFGSGQGRPRTRANPAPFPGALRQGLFPESAGRVAPRRPGFDCPSTCDLARGGRCPAADFRTSDLKPGGRRRRHRPSRSASLKRGTLGRLSACAKKHLKHYLAEIDVRCNNRVATASMICPRLFRRDRDRVLVQMCVKAKTEGPEVGLRVRVSSRPADERPK